VRQQLGEVETPDTAELADAPTPKARTDEDTACEETVRRVANGSAATRRGVCIGLRVES